jgi:protoheme IX farnesyltransferase
LSIPLVEPRPARSKFSAYIALTKPRIIELLLVTTVPTMFLASGGWPNWQTVLFTLIGGTLAAGGANALNNVADRDIDSLMQRTGHRPLVTGEVSPKGALALGLVLSFSSVIFLSFLVNNLAAALAAAAILFYVFIYTLLLKRRTSQNIVWGGIAGCFPVLIGWAAVTNSLSLAPVVLFMIVFWWTPPHYWPLSMQYNDDYLKSKVPMLPTVASERTVVLNILIYSWIMAATTFLLPLVADVGWVYLTFAVVANAVFLYQAHALQYRSVRNLALKPMRLFNYSITYLALIFFAVGLDPLIG